MKPKFTNFIYKPILLLIVMLFFNVASKAQFAYNSFTRTYNNGSDASAQCIDFNTWRATLTRTDYTRVNFTNGTTTFVCSTAVTVQALADYMRTSVVSSPIQSWTDGSNVWSISGTCGAGIEISVKPTASTCFCDNSTAIGTLRPCINTGNPNWGGVGTATCSGPTQDITLEFGWNVSSGPPQPPIANFYAPDTVWINSPATLINTSSFQSRVFWDFPNENPLQTGYFRQAGFIDTARFTNNITYTFTSRGLKLVKLLAVNNLKRDSLRDSIFKYIYVDTPSQAPRADFITFKRIMGITEEAQFIDLSTNGPTQWDWIIDPPCISCITDPANGIANYFVTGSGQPGNLVASPRLAAFDAGLFKVCLRVWNLRGTDSICKSNYIKVVEGNYMCSGSGGFSSAKEEGFLYGISGPYQTYARSSWPSNCPGFTINPCADSITLYVERIKMWPTDSIVIYNGPDINS
ncbi:MAG: hypothetical protein WCI53_13570, partial [Bacteroidota bacterium]